MNLMLLNFILVQHFSVALRQAEVAFILFSLAYFSGISIGVMISDGITKDMIKNVLPCFLGIQMAILISSQSLFYVLDAHLTTTATYFVIFSIIACFSTSLYAVFLPQSVDGEGTEIGRSYSIEIVGSILGLILIPLLASVSHELLLFGYFASFIGICALLGLNRKIIFSFIIAVFGFLLKFNDLDKACAGWFYREWYASKPIEGIVYTKYTPYHKIEVAKLENDQYMLILNGKRQFAQGSHFTYSYFVAEFPAQFFKFPVVGVLGCGSMSTVGRIGEHAKTISIVDLDEEVFKTSRRFFQPYNHIDQLKNWTFRADDAKHFIANSKDKFDLILHDIPPGRSRQTALTYTAEFFNLVKQRLTPNGIFSISALSVTESDSDYGRKMMATLAATFDRYFVLEYEGSFYFYGGGIEMEIPSRENILADIQHPDKAQVRILLQEDVKVLVEGEEIITINNVGDLIFG